MVDRKSRIKPSSGPSPEEIKTRRDALNITSELTTPRPKVPKMSKVPRRLAPKVTHVSDDLAPPSAPYAPASPSPSSLPKPSSRLVPRIATTVANPPPLPSPSTTTPSSPPRTSDTDSKKTTKYHPSTVMPGGTCPEGYVVKSVKGKVFCAKKKPTKGYAQPPWLKRYAFTSEYQPRWNRAE